MDNFTSEFNYTYSNCSTVDENSTIFQEYCQQNEGMYKENRCQMKNFHSNIFFSDSAYGMPWWRQLIWSILFVAMATTATCGNLIVIWIVMSHRRMRTVTNYFIGKKSHFLSNFQTYCIDLP